MVKILFLIFVFHGVTYSQTAPAEGYFVKELFVSELISTVVDSLNKELDEDLSVYKNFVLDKTDRDCLSEPLGIVKRLVTYRPIFIGEDEFLIEYSGCRVSQDRLSAVVFSLPIINSYQNVLFFNVEYNERRYCFEFEIPTNMIIQRILHVQRKHIPDTTSIMTESERLFLDTFTYPHVRSKNKKEQ